MRLLDIISFGVYISLMVGIGVFFYFKKRSASSFMVGDGHIPAWVISLSIFATFVSSISYLALPGSAYQGNWNSFVFSLSIPVAAVMAVKYFVPLYRQVNSPSAFTFLEHRFGAWARIYASSMYLLTQIVRTGTILYLMALVPNMMFGWSVPAVIIGTSLIVMLYSLIGGIRAVVWTDAVQAIVLIGGALITVAVISSKLPDGVYKIFQSGVDNNKFSLGSFSLVLSQPTFWVVLAYGLCINLQNYGVDQNYIQRYMASSSLQDAQRSAFWGALLYIPVSLVFLFIGTSLFVLYQSRGGLPNSLNDAAQADKVFPYFIAHEMPSGVTGLLLASIFAAGMSTISTSYNSVATIILTDYAERISKRPISEAKRLRVLYGSTVIISLLGIAVGVAMVNSKSALDTWWKMASILSGGVLGLFLLGAFTKIKSQRSVLISIAIGLMVIIILTLYSLALDSIFHPYLTIVFGTTTIFISGIILGFLINRHLK